MPENIRSLGELAPHVSVGAMFKLSSDGGNTWEYVKIVRATVEPFSNGARGYQAHAERLRGGSDHCNELTDRKFNGGAIVRVATAQEVQGKKWSYE
jgi:hypothetical protein